MPAAGTTVGDADYLAERTLKWLESVACQGLSNLGLDLGALLQNGKLLKKVALGIEGSVNTSRGGAFSRADLTEERKGFQAVTDVDYFLGCCRSLGLKDAQLFTTSDVTTVGDLLRVCRTVRALSLHCPERFPVFETVKQREEARRRSMSREATSGKVSALGTKLGLNKAEEDSCRGSGGTAVAALIVGAVAFVATVAIRAVVKANSYHLVRKGDTLCSLSRKRGAKLEDLVEKNPTLRSNPDLIFEKQKIRL